MKKRGLLNSVNTEEVILAQSKVIVETPYGVFSYSGKLTEKTELTGPKGETVLFYTLISQTNGYCLPYFVEPKHTK